MNMQIKTKLLLYFLIIKSISIAQSRKELRVEIERLRVDSIRFEEKIIQTNSHINDLNEQLTESITLLNNTQDKFDHQTDKFKLLLNQNNDLKLENSELRSDLIDFLTECKKSNQLNFLDMDFKLSKSDSIKIINRCYEITNMDSFYENLGCFGEGSPCAFITFSMVYQRQCEKYLLIGLNHTIGDFTCPHYTYGNNSLILYKINKDKTLIEISNFPYCGGSQYGSPGGFNNIIPIGTSNFLIEISNWTYFHTGYLVDNCYVLCSENKLQILEPFSCYPEDDGICNNSLFNYVEEGPNQIEISSNIIRFNPSNQKYYDFDLIKIERNPKRNHKNEQIEGYYNHFSVDIIHYSPIIDIDANREIIRGYSRSDQN